MHKLLVIYDVRYTIYDLNASTPEAGGACLCTKYEVRLRYSRALREGKWCVSHPTREERG